MEKVYPRTPIKQGLHKITSWDEIDLTDSVVIATLANVYGLLLWKVHHGSGKDRTEMANAQGLFTCETDHNDHAPKHFASRESVVYVSATD